MEIKSYLSDDHIDLIDCLNRNDVNYLLIGGVAVAYHGYVRATYDVDFFFQNKEENVKRLLTALDAFFGGIGPEIGTYEDLMQPSKIFRFGKPPNRVELLNEIDGVSFQEAWDHREEMSAEGTTIPVIGRKQLLKNKQASERDKDQVDYNELKKVQE